MEFNKLKVVTESNNLNLNEERICIECNEVKTVNDFNRRRRSSGIWYVDKRCTKCHYEIYKKTYSKRNKDRYKNEDFREKKKQYSRDYRQQNPELIMFQSARSRCKAANIKFNIEVSDIIIPDTCPILEIPLVLDNRDYNKDNSPSLDRINPAKGYTKDNVKVISYKANVMKNDASLEQIKTFCKNIFSYMQVDDIV